MHPATVYIVGAGPGDPSLITARGLRFLTQADVVVYDHLVHPRLLRHARPEAERIDVGAAAPQPLAQEAINLLLVEKAREGKRVVRLKWGDPYVFDSGGKEALFLHEQRIPFEVVPGVPALVASPCYAGVPVTYPGAGDTLTFVRGHEDGTNRPIKVDWDALARLDGSIVCYAGPRQLPDVVDALLAHGRSPKEWAAIVWRGTLPQQSTLHGTLGDLQQALKRDDPSREAGILVVGSVVGLREHLRWFDARPLFGKRVLVTRSREQAGELIDLLEDLGAEAIEAPSIRIVPPTDQAAVDEARAAAGSFDWIVFTSANGVEHFMRRLLAGPLDVRALKGAAALRDRAGHGRAPGPIRHQGRPHADRVPGRGRGRGPQGDR
jgi:uroporphyrinogen III methyltransferase / synthase